MAKLDFSHALRVGEASELLPPHIAPKSDGGGGEEEFLAPETGESPRGLALKSLRVGGDSGFFSFFDRHADVYFVSLAFDLSGDKPLVLPPEGVDASKYVYKVSKGETIEFNLGDGAPLFPPKALVGSLVVYVMVAESDDASRHIGEVMKQVHDDLDKDGLLLVKIKDFLTKPGQAVANEVLAAASAALEPIATILKGNRDDPLPLFQGIYGASESWDGKLTETRNGATITLAEM